MKVLFMTNIPSPYRVDFFNEWGKYCDLTVTFTDRFYAHRDKSWQDFRFENFKGVFLKGKTWRGRRICFDIKKVIKEGKFDKIVCADFTSPTGMIAIRYMRKHKIPYWLESDGGFAKSGKGFKEKIKRHFIKGAAGYFSTAIPHDEYYLTYGAEKDRLHRYPFTSLFEKDLVKSVPTKEDKLALREKLGITEEKVVLAVGRFIPLKGFNLLLKAAAELPKNIGFYFVGGVPTEEYLALREEYKLANVHFVGFKNKEDLKEYYQAADVFALPTWGDAWGLVINEAMANGLPVVTTDKCVAGLELVKDGENGYIVPVGNAEVLRTAIGNVLDGDLTAMSENSLEKIQPYTIENMAKVHLEILD